MNKKSCLMIAVLSCTAAIAGCVGMHAWMFGTITGQVVEQGTGRPISGAIVLGLWEEPGFHRTLCVRAETATTDASGNYGLPKVRGENPNRFYVYKPGYAFDEQVHFDPLPSMRNPVVLQTFSGTTKERLDALNRLDGHTLCLDAAKTGTRENFLPLGRAMYEEAKSIASTSDDNRFVNHLLFGIEEKELGYRAASERQLAREKARLGQ